MKYIAFFDLDYTILNMNSGAALLRRAYKNGILSRKQLFIAYGASILNKFRLIDPLRIIEKFVVWISDFPVEEFEILCKDIVEKDLLPAIRPQIRDEIKKHKEGGARIVILSTTIDTLCVPLAKHLGIDDVLCSELEEKDLHYTGRPKGKFCFREEKLVRMKSYLQMHESSLETSWYYGDSIDDLPVLKSVGFPACVCPDKGLKKIARAKDWVVYDWDEGTIN